MTIHMTPTISEEQIAAMSPYAAYRLGEDLLESRFPRDAARVLRRVVEEAPDNATGWELLGRACFAAALLAPAEEAFRRLVELEPTNAWARTALGLALNRQRRHDEGAVQHRIADALGGDGTRATFAPAEESLRRAEESVRRAEESVRRGEESLRRRRGQTTGRPAPSQASMPPVRLTTSWPCPANHMVACAERPPR